MASSSSSTPVSFSQTWNHEVFLSFRGEDTRKTFVDHLYTALVQHGIYTYKDDEELPRGESIHPALMKAIRESRIAVIVFSENYADSSWCLDELAYIIKCRDEVGQIVVPIFYHVDPSEVLKQNGKYEEAFAKHELKNNSKVESWRRTLLEAGSLAGWVLQDVANGHESKFIKGIVEAISNKLFPLISSTDKNLVGLRTRLQNLKSDLEISSGGVRMVGIWGLGGGGKTTLASSVYDKICSKFEGCCFAENIREESNKNGLEKLQVKILCGVLKQEKVSIARVHEGRQLIKSRLCHKKVLIVLDDVDHLNQLEALAGSYDWFGEGSRIIITTRDEHLLKAHKVKLIHNISLLDDNEAIELFCKHAPWYKYNIIVKDYELLSKEVVSYAHGLPFAIKVLGCFLCDKNTNEWRDALARLKEIPEDDILKKLKVSYDGLNDQEKQMFLDIACFFRWSHKDDAMDIFEACGFYPVAGVKVLTQKALITINDGYFDMHDLVQELGHYIVRGKYPCNPEKHSRVWKHEDIQTLCAMDETTELDNIEVVTDGHLNNLSLSFQNHHVVANMKKLRWIEWNGNSERSLTTNSLPVELRCLVLRKNQQIHLWEGSKNLPNLRMIKLERLRNLIEIPDFGGLPKSNLERFELYGCPQLEEIHPSIGGLGRLVHLIVSGCDNLKMFPPITRSLKLQTFKISSCVNLFKVIKFLKQRMMEVYVASCKQKRTSYLCVVASIFMLTQNIMTSIILM